MSKKNTVDIVGILDRSGSMQTLIDETISGYNAFIKEQRKEGPARVTLAIFDDQYDVVYDSIDIDLVPKLTKDILYARGMTSLRDAVGKTIRTVRGTQKNGSRPDKTLVFIVTDGYENASKEFTQEQIQKLVKKQKKKGWEFFFMGADIDAFSQGGNIGVATANIATTDKSKAGTDRVYYTMSSVANLYRSGGALSSSLTMEDLYENAE